MLPGRPREPELRGHGLDKFVEPFVEGATETPGNLQMAQRLMHPAISDLVASGVEIRKILELLTGGSLVGKPEKRRAILLKTAEKLGEQMKNGHLILGEGVFYSPKCPDTVGGIRAAKRRDAGIECWIGDEGLADYFCLALEGSLRHYGLGASLLRKYTSHTGDRVHFMIYIDTYLKDPEFRRLLNIAIVTNLDFRKNLKGTEVFDEGSCRSLKKERVSLMKPLGSRVQLLAYCVKNPTEQVDLTRWQVFRTALALG